LVDICYAGSATFIATLGLAWSSAAFRDRMPQRLAHATRNNRRLAESGTPH
jgi:hypothetical protein